MAIPINFQVTIPVGPLWKNVELLRSAILNCLAAIFHDSDVTHQVSIVTGELLENAVKYGDWSPPTESRLQLRVWGDESEVNVEVSNPARTDNGGVTELFRMVDWINSFPTAQEAYLARLCQLAEKGEQESVSQLGLARILYECNCKLDTTLDDGMIRILAVVPGTTQSVEAN